MGLHLQIERVMVCLEGEVMEIVESPATDVIQQQLPALASTAGECQVGSLLMM